MLLTITFQKTFIKSQALTSILVSYGFQFIVLVKELYPVILGLKFITF